jgi:rhodanese-related sulfurtransferase
MNLPHPMQIDIAVPENLWRGRPPDGHVPHPADWGPVRQTYGGVLEIDPPWVAEHRGEVHVLDVRQPQEAKAPPGRIAGSQLIPIAELRARVAEVPRDRPVVAVCHSGARSAQATVILKAAGVERYANLHGGMLLWSELGLPAERAV